MAVTMKEILYGKYKIQRLIGAGGGGKVYLALDMHLDRPVAVKECVEDFSRQEMELLRELKHPGLPEIYDFFIEQEKAWMVMEYIEGITLRRYLDRHERVKEEQAVRWAAELCRILGYLHNRHPAVVYRDLKPENIMIGQDGKVKLIDLGAAVRPAWGREGIDGCAGTPGYSPPEQWKVTGPDPVWDIYGLGAVLHEMLTGANPTKPPYERRPLAEYDKGLPGTLEAIIEGCTGERCREGTGIAGGGMKGKSRFSSTGQVEEALGCYQKKQFPGNLMNAAGKLLMFIFILKGGSCLAVPLLRGVPGDQFPFPFLIKPLLYFMWAFFFYRLLFRRKDKNMFLRRQEKNIWLTEKRFSGLPSFFLFLCPAVLMTGILCVTAPAAHAGDNAGKLWVEMRDEQGRKLLLKNDAVYITNDCVRFELPADRMPREEFLLQMVASGQNGDIYSSRLFRIRVQEDLN